MEKKITMPEHLKPPKPSHGQLIFDSDTKKVWMYDASAKQWIDLDGFIKAMADATKQVAESFKKFGKAFRKIAESRAIQNDSETKH